MVARRVEQIPTMRRVDVKEDTGDDDCLLFKKFFEEGLGDTCKCAVSSALSPHLPRQNRNPWKGKNNEVRTRPLLRGEGNCSRLSQI